MNVDDRQMGDPMKFAAANFSVDETTLSQIFEDYWSRDEVQGYTYRTQEIIEKYNLSIRISNLARLLYANNFRKEHSICEFCGKMVYEKSRNARVWCSCEYRGICESCSKPYKTGKKDEEYNGEICLNCWTDAYNFNRFALECHPDEPKLSQNEENILNIFKHHRDKIFTKDDVDIPKISFLLKKSVKFTCDLFDSVMIKGYIQKRAFIKEDEFKEFIDYKIGGVVVKLTKPDLIVEQKLTPMVVSKPGREVFALLQSKYPYVFAEVVPSSFIKFESIKNELTEEERGWFFTRRIDFLCTDERFMPLLAVEYNGDYHWVNSLTDNTDYIRRKFKRKVCDLVGMTLLEINSYKQIETRLKVKLEESL